MNLVWASRLRYGRRLHHDAQAGCFATSAAARFAARHREAEASLSLLLNGKQEAESEERSAETAKRPNSPRGERTAAETDGTTTRSLPGTRHALKSRALRRRAPMGRCTDTLNIDQHLDLARGACSSAHAWFCLRGFAGASRKLTASRRGQD